MKKTIYLLFVMCMGLLVTISGCLEQDVESESCSEIEYSVTSLDGSSAHCNGNGCYHDASIKVYTPDDKPFTENLTVIVTGYFDKITLDIKVGDESPFSADRTLRYYDSFQANDPLEGISATIQTEFCPDPVEQSNAAIEAASNILECNQILELFETACDPYLFSWTASDVSDVIVSVYGVEIDLSQESPISFPISALDLEDSIASFTGGDYCHLVRSITECESGTTGSVTLTDPIAAGEDLIVTVTDPDLAGGADFDLTVTSSLGESETVTLTETESGLFVGTLSTLLSNEAGEPEDGTLNIENGLMISVRYTDELNDEGNLEAITVTIMVSGDFAPSCTDGIQNGNETGIDCGGSCGECPSGSIFTYAGTQYGIDYGSEWFADMLMGTYTASYNFAKSENDASGLAIDFTLKSDSPITSGTYTYDASTTGIEAGATIAVDNVSNDVTGGSVTLTIEANSDYTFVMNLTTASGSLTGTYTIPSGNVYSNL